MSEIAICQNIISMRSLNGKDEYDIFCDLNEASIADRYLRAALGVILVAGSHSRHRRMKSVNNGSSHPAIYCVQILYPDIYYVQILYPQIYYEQITDPVYGTHSFLSFVYCFDDPDGGFTFEGSLQFP